MPALPGIPWVTHKSSLQNLQVHHLQPETRGKISPAMLNDLTMSTSRDQCGWWLCVWHSIAALKLNENFQFCRTFPSHASQSQLFSRRNTLDVLLNWLYCCFCCRFGCGSLVGLLFFWWNMVNSGKLEFACPFAMATCAWWSGAWLHQRITLDAWRLAGIVHQVRWSRGGHPVWPGVSGGDIKVTTSTSQRWRGTWWNHVKPCEDRRTQTSFLCCRVVMNLLWRSLSYYSLRFVQSTGRVMFSFKSYDSHIEITINVLWYWCRYCFSIITIMTTKCQLI